MLVMRKIIFCLLLVVSVFMSNLSYAQGIVVRVNGEVVQQMGNVSDEKKESKKGDTCKLPWHNVT